MRPVDHYFNEALQNRIADGRLSKFVYNGNRFHVRTIARNYRFWSTAMSIDIANLRDLTVNEKLRIVTILWEDIARAEPRELLGKSQIDEIHGRSAELAENPSLAIDEEELWRRVDG